MDSETILRKDPLFENRATVLAETGRILHALGLVPATSGNLSARLDEARIAVTVSGRHKGRLQPADILVVDLEGQSLDSRTPSAETPLHLQIYRRFPDAGYVLHSHSVNSTVLSRLVAGCVVLQDYELLKAFPGIDTHDCRVTVPNFRNDQNIRRLAREIDAWMDNFEGPVFGYLLAGHGFYTWGDRIDDALRHVEALEFLFDCELRTRGVTKR